MFCSGFFIKRTEMKFYRSLSDSEFFADLAIFSPAARPSKISDCRDETESAAAAESFDSLFLPRFHAALGRICRTRSDRRRTCSAARGERIPYDFRGTRCGSRRSMRGQDHLRTNAAAQSMAIPANSSYQSSALLVLVSAAVRSSQFSTRKISSAQSSNARASPIAAS